MTCDDRKYLIPFYAVGILDPIEMELLRKHLDGGCSVCQAELSEFESLAGDLAMALEPVAPPARVRERLMRRIADDGPHLTLGKDRASVIQTPNPANDAMQISRSSSSGGDWFRSMATAAVAAALAYFAASTAFQGHQTLLQKRLVQVESQLTEMQTTQKTTEQMITLPRSPAMQVVTLQGTPDAPGAKADLFYDRARGVWYLYTTGLKPPGEKRAYELWFIAGETKTRAGVFDVTPEGEGSLIAAVPPDLGRITLAAVSDEPAGGSMQPTGKIRLAGAIP